jgi:CelD/BcsL family acetyltransferase involved in cellulose biosynthesis
MQLPFMDGWMDLTRSDLGHGPQPFTNGVCQIELAIRTIFVRISARRREAVSTERSQNEARKIHFSPDPGRKAATVALHALTSHEEQKTTKPTWK